MPNIGVIRPGPRFAKSCAFEGGRIVLLSRSGAMAYTDFAFAPGDIILLGRESAGVPGEVRDAARRGVADSVEAGLTLAQCRPGGRDGIGRGATADEEISG